ncbi:cytochrome c-type biogenesis protein CcmH [soil metagenome]
MIVRPLPIKRDSARAVWGTILFSFLLIAAPAFADSSMPKAHYADTQLADPKQEADAHALMESVRCLVCQGQSIADSDAELAADMRAMIRRRIAAGEKPEAIRSWLIERYGDWVSYKPVFDAATAPLWIAPFLLIAAGLWLARGRFRKRRG